MFQAAKKCFIFSNNSLILKYNRHRIFYLHIYFKFSIPITLISSSPYDYVIVGAGAAGIHLLLAMLKDPFFQNRRILILEKNEKKGSEKTWSFWEKGDGKWEQIIRKEWSKAAFITNNHELELNLLPYRYKTILEIDFYNWAKKEVKNNPTIDWIQDEVLEIEDKAIVILKGKKDNYRAHHVFDSRPPLLNTIKFQSNITVLQHFKGFFLETEQEVFDPKVFTMMDFRIKHNNSTSFTYVLPFTEKEALIEFTLFTPDLIEDEEYTLYLKQYLKNYIGTEQFTIQKVEKGIIPMTTYPFYKFHKEKITNIGTAGGWVKPSSGYSFKNSERNAKKVVENIKRDFYPANGLTNPRFRFYDRVFLRLLYEKNFLGEELFSDMYMKNKIENIFRFLDEETTVAEELRLISNFRKLPFMKAAFKQLVKTRS